MGHGFSYFHAAPGRSMESAFLTKSSNQQYQTNSTTGPVFCSLFFWFGIVLDCSSIHTQPSDTSVRRVTHHLATISNVLHSILKSSCQAVFGSVEMFRSVLIFFFCHHQLYPIALFTA